MSALWGKEGLTAKGEDKGLQTAVGKAQGKEQRWSQEMKGKDPTSTWGRIPGTCGGLDVRSGKVGVSRVTGSCCHGTSESLLERKEGLS